MTLGVTSCDDELALDCREGVGGRGGGGGVAFVSSVGLECDGELLSLDSSLGRGGGGGCVVFVSSAGLGCDDELAHDCSGGGGGGGGVTFVSSAELECAGALLSFDGRLGRGGGGGEGRGGGGDVFSGFLDGLVMVRAACTLFFSLCFNSSLGSSIGVDQLLCIIPLAILGFIGVLVSSGESIGSSGNILETGFASSPFASKLSMTLSVVVAPSS